MRLIASWAAIFGLYLHLAATALCLTGSPVSLSINDAGQAASPICHTPADPHGGNPSDGQRPDQAPDHPQTCAFCSPHCHGNLAAAPAIRLDAPLVIAASDAEPPLFVIRPFSRVRTDAAPRGPPSAG